MPGVAARVVTIAGICRFTGKDELQICYFDPDLVAPGAKRPEKFESTPANGAVLITMKRKP